MRVTNCARAEVKVSILKRVVTEGVSGKVIFEKTKGRATGG